MQLFCVENKNNLYLTNEMKLKKIEKNIGILLENKN